MRLPQAVIDTFPVIIYTAAAQRSPSEVRGSPSIRLNNQLGIWRHSTTSIVSAEASADRAGLASSLTATHMSIGTEITLPQILEIGSVTTRRHCGGEFSDVCAVCLNDFEAGEALRQLPCYHAFHVACVDPWISLHGTCPVCRTMLCCERMADTVVNQLGFSH
jgi:hypothetical protein